MEGVAADGVGGDAVVVVAVDAAVAVAVAVGPVFLRAKTCLRLSQ